MKKSRNRDRGMYLSLFYYQFPIINLKILNYIQPLPWTLFYESMTNSSEICWHNMGLRSALYLF